MIWRLSLKLPMSYMSVRTKNYLIMIKPLEFNHLNEMQILTPQSYPICIGTELFQCNVDLVMIQPVPIVIVLMWGVSKALDHHYMQRVFWLPYILFHQSYSDDQIRTP